MPRYASPDYDPMMDELPPELAAQYKAEQRKQKIAALMSGQAMTPLQAPEVKGRFQGAISPIAGLAQLAQAYMSNKMAENADKGIADIGQRKQDMYSADVKRVGEVMTGRPDQVLPPDVAGPPQPGTPAGTPEQVAAAMMESKFPSIARHGFGQLDQAQKQKQIAADRAALAEQAAYDRAEREKQNAADRFAQQKSMALLAASLRPAPQGRAEPAVTPVTIQDPDDPNKTVIIDGRTRQVLGAGPKLSQAGGNDAKLQQSLPQAKLRVTSISQNLDRLDQAMTELHDNPDLSRITGSIAGRTPNITNKATGAQTDLNSIKSQIFQSSLQAMREASKTGGAVGNVSDKEGDKLERTLAGLDQAAGTPKFRENLKKAREQVRTSKAIIQQAFEEQYGGVAPAAPSGAGAPAGGGAVRTVDW
jgi:hypothetical protein